MGVGYWPFSLFHGSRVRPALIPRWDTAQLLLSLRLSSFRMDNVSRKPWKTTLTPPHTLVLETYISALVAPCCQLYHSRVLTESF